MLPSSVIFSTNFIPTVCEASNNEAAHEHICGGLVYDNAIAKESCHNLTDQGKGRLQSEAYLPFFVFFFFGFSIVTSPWINTHGRRSRGAAYGVGGFYIR